MEKYLEMTIAQLKEEAKERGIKGVSAMKKQELAELLDAADRMMEQKKKMATAKKEVADKQRPTQQAGTVSERQTQRPTAERPAPARPVSERPAPRPTVERSVAQSRPVSERPAAERPVQQARPISERPAPRPAAERPISERPATARPPQEGTVATTAPDNAQQAQPTRFDPSTATEADIKRLDSGETRKGILEVMPEGFAFIRCDNFLPGENDVYVSPAYVRRYGLRTGDIICGNTKIRAQNEKFSALLYFKDVNGRPVEEVAKRPKFEDLTPIFPNERIHLETQGCSLSMRMVDLISPIGKGQRGMIVSQPKTGKTTLLKQIAKAITTNHPNMHLIILLIDERPEEVTDIKESIEGKQVEVIYSTFDELPENHKRVSEMVIERAKRLVEQKEDVVILLDSITRLARAYNLTVAPSGRTLSGGLDPAALHMPKKFFGAARNMREGGSLTILATALVDTGSRMDDVVFEEFKGTGNMELQLDRNLSERRVFPAIDLLRSSTRRDDLLLTKEEQEATALMRRMFNGVKAEESLESIMRTFQSTKNNAEFVQMVKKIR